MLDQFGCQRNFLNLKNKTLLNSKNSSDSQIRLGVGIFSCSYFQIGQHVVLLLFVKCIETFSTDGFQDGYGNRK